MISSLHYISQENECSHEENILAACQAGVKWVQLRIKHKKIEEVEEMARRSKEICRKYGATFILNDYVEIAEKVGADGVHVGKTDMVPDEVRKYLTDLKIVGGTANTFEDIQRLADFEVDYIGFGPFRFTSTKEKLSPIIGLEGYKKVMAQCRDYGIHIPVVAIGGIGISDIRAIMATGVHGVAVASLINNAADRKERVTELKNELSHSHVENS